MWGYDISSLSLFRYEAEILLEPEAKVRVISCRQEDSFQHIEVEFQPFDHLSLDDVIPIRHYKEITKGWMKRRNSKSLKCIITILLMALKHKKSLLFMICPADIGWCIKK